MNTHKKLSIAAVAAMSMMVNVSAVSADDFYAYDSLQHNFTGSYGVDGYVGADGIDRIIFYSGTIAHIYTVTIPDGSEANMHPDNPDAQGAVAPRTFTHEKEFQLGVSCLHECEFYVDEAKNDIYLGAAVGIRKYVDDGVGNYVYDSMVAPSAPMGEGFGTQSLAYEPDTNTWYAGAMAWNNDPGVTPRKMWKYDGNQGSSGNWVLAFEYTTPEEAGTHHDGLEFVNGSLWVADYTGAYIKQYATNGTLQNIFVHGPLSDELEGMGFGALGHFWVGSHGNVITEIGGGGLQQDFSVNFDIHPGGCPNPLNKKSKGVTPMAILGTGDFNVEDINVSSLKVNDVSPTRSALEDVATPYEGGLSDPLSRDDCSEAGADGIMDLTLKFDTQAVLENVDKGVQMMEITGETLDGTPFTGKDVVWVK